MQHANLGLIVITILCTLGFIITQQRSKGVQILWPICFLAIFQVGGTFWIETEERFWVFLITNLMWTPLAIDDFFNKSVPVWSLIISTGLSGIAFLYFDINTLNLLITVVITLLAARLIILFMETMLSTQLLGGADYLAAFAFISSLHSHVIGYWIMLFSLLGILHAVRASKTQETIPLIPFMLASWCLVFSMSS
jgi:hypothetical protein